MTTHTTCGPNYPKRNGTQPKNPPTQIPGIMECRDAPRSRLYPGGWRHATRATKHRLAAVSPAAQRLARPPWVRIRAIAPAIAYSPTINRSASKTAEQPQPQGQASHCWVSQHLGDHARKARRTALAVACYNNAKAAPRIKLRRWPVWGRDVADRILPSSL